MAPLFLDPVIIKYKSEMPQLHYLFSIYQEIINSNDISNPSLKKMIDRYKLMDKSYQFGKPGDADEVFTQIYKYIDDPIISKYVSCNPAKPSYYLFVNLHQYPNHNIEIMKVIDNKNYLLVSAIIYSGGHWTSLRLIKGETEFHDYYFINDIQSIKLSRNQLIKVMSSQIITVCYIKN
jgi:hypothetical protein